MSTQFPVVAAIDFGTHGTGYAWIEVKPENQEARYRNPHFQERWHGTNRFYPKTLTALLLGPDGEVVEWGHPAKTEWTRLATQQANEGYTYVSGFKMALKADAMQGRRPPGIGARSIDSPAKALPLIVEYLRRMYQVALAEIQLSGYLEDQIRWCVTVPAIWDDAEKALMRQAARQAGMPADRHRLLLAIEPEVAALHCQIHLARVLGSQDQKIQPADGAQRFMVVDCGGGTVDITAYRIDRSEGKEKFVEIGQVSGGKLGSEYINQAFIDEVLQDRFGGPAAVEELRAQCPAEFAQLVDAWESSKVTASIEIDDGIVRFRDPILLPLPGEILDRLAPNVRDRLLTLPLHQKYRIAVSTEECLRLFDRVAVNIVELIQKQLAEMTAQDGPPTQPERLLLVGGMSASRYLQERLREAFDGTAMIIVPTEPAAAVLFGAVHFAYEPDVIKARRSKYTYGCSVSMVFEDGTDPQEKLDVVDGRRYCGDRFEIFVRRGQTVDVDNEYTHRFYPLRDGHDQVGLVFYRSSLTEPRYIDQEGCERVGRSRSRSAPR
jgi:molecular chaperone DnaK (HSP70)